MPRYQGDLAGLAMLPEAGQAYLRTLRNQHPSTSSTGANLFRLAGDHVMPDELLLTIRDGLAADHPLRISSTRCTACSVRTVRRWTWTSGRRHVNLHDWLELALVVQSESAAAVSPRLREG